MGPQVIQIDWKSYRWVMVRARSSASNSSRHFDIILRCPVNSSWTSIDVFASVDTAGSVPSFIRRLMRACDDGLELSDCWQKHANSTSYSVANDHIIPVYAYGLQV